MHELFQRSRQLHKSLNRVLKKYGLFAAQWSVLYTIYREGPMSLTAIWTYLNVEAPTVTRTVSRLEELGWLEVSYGQDRRERLVALSEQAVAQLPAIIEAVIQFEHDYLDHLSEDEQSQLMTLLQKLEENRD